MKKEKKPMSKDTKKLIIIASSFIVVLIVGIVCGVIFPQLNKKEIEISAQPENIQEENIIKEESTLQGENKNLYTTVSDNYYGMRFNKTIAEFCEGFNNALEEGYKVKEIDTILIEVNKLQSSDFKYIRTQNGNRQYTSQKMGYTIGIATENDSDYIVDVSVAYYYITSTSSKEFIQGIIYPSVISGLMDTTYQQSVRKLAEIIDIIAKENKSENIKDNILYKLGNINGNDIFAMTSITGKRLEELRNNEISTENSSYYEDIQEIKDNSSSTTQQSSSTDTSNIKPSIGNKENSSSDTGNIKPLTGNKENNSSNNSSSNQSSISNNNEPTNSNNSNKNNSQPSNANNNESKKYEPKEITTTLNIRIKDLIAKNKTAQEIVKSENIYTRIEIKINGDTVDTIGKSYHGADEIPNTVTEKYSATLTEDNPAAKVTVIIQIYDNTEGTETTLYNKDITTNKTSTQEIK